VDFDLKKVIEDSNQPEKRIESRKAVKKILEEKYKTQSAKADKKSGGAQYFFKKLRF
jgi:hypothetical protein